MLPHVDKSERGLTPPAPPPPPDPPEVLPPPPPPATIKASMNLVPACVVKVPGPLAVIDVTVSLPKEVLLLTPIIPPFADPEGLAI